jgi:hypothetical protein
VRRPPPRFEGKGSFEFEFDSMKVLHSGAIQVQLIVPFEHSDNVLALRSALGLLLCASVTLVERKGA